MSRSDFARDGSFFHSPQTIRALLIGLCHLGIELNGFIEVRQGPVNLAFSEERPAAIHVGRGPIGRQPDRLIEVGQRAVEVPPEAPQPAAHPEGIHILGVLCDRPIEMGHGLVERDDMVDADPAAVPAIGQGDEHAVAVNPLDLEVETPSPAETRWPSPSPRSEMSGDLRTTAVPTAIPPAGAGPAGWRPLSS